MAQRATTHRHRMEKAMPRPDVVPSNAQAGTPGGFAALLESAVQEVLAVTYWFDPAQHAGPYPVTVRFSGRRAGVKGRLSSGDRFVQDETIDQVVPGSGPISVTARVRGIHAGEWNVTAHVLGSASSSSVPHEQKCTVSEEGSPRPVTRLWRRWAPSVESVATVKTCLAPFVHVPGILPGIWAVMVTLGMVVALALQALVIAAIHRGIGPWWAVSLLAIAIGIVGAKAWYLVLYRREHLINGWCIQGFITGAVMTTAILLAALGVPAGTFLDVTAPGLLIAMAIGRVGCFFAGCCGGPPTASRWGVWSSDQRVGARRVPTQLLELALALSLGVGALVAVLYRGPAGGVYFVGGLAAYTLGRQGILRLRAEPRRTRQGGPVIAVVSALVLIASVVWPLLH